MELTYIGELRDVEKLLKKSNCQSAKLAKPTAQILPDPLPRGSRLRKRKPPPRDARHTNVCPVRISFADAALPIIKVRGIVSAVNISSRVAQCILSAKSAVFIEKRSRIISTVFGIDIIDDMSNDDWYCSALNKSTRELYLLSRMVTLCTPKKE